MFDLETTVRSWRRGLERKSSLSPRELDELEDHLRAHVDLELELDAALAPARAFALASEWLGEPAQLSKEFAKAGARRWRRLLVTGWAMFVVSFFLPVLSEVRFPFADPGTVWGWGAFYLALTEAENPIQLLSALSNALVLMTFLKLGGTRPPRARWLAPVMTSAAVLNLYWVVSMVTGGDSVTILGVGYWAWIASFACVAAALRLRDREWASAKPEESPA